MWRMYLKRIIKILRVILFPVHPFCLKSGVNLRQFNCIELSGDAVLCTRDYPIPSAKITKGKVYNVVDEWLGKKMMKNFDLPIRFLEILNDDQEPVSVSIHHFEKIN